ncbi:MAG: hypothetical protein EBU59_11850 [Planctomycetia bacterium]|nr:hypothetical protein [Planctomycetia bacterium]
MTAGGRQEERPLWGGVILTVESIPLFYPGSLSRGKSGLLGPKVLGRKPATENLQHPDVFRAGQWEIVEESGLNGCGMA